MFPAPLLTFLLVVLSSMIVVRIGTRTLVKTGLSADVAGFQAVSAFTGVGFTTSEAEYVVNHPVRRRIVKWLMMSGSAGLTSAIASLVLTFVGNTPEEMMFNSIGIGVGLLALYLASRSKLLDRVLDSFLEWASARWSRITIVDYEELLGISRGYAISIIRVRPGCWLNDRSLGELRLRDEGVVVLGVYRQVDGREVYIGAPRSDFIIREGDRLVCYGPEDVLRELPERIKGPKGDREHTLAVARQRVREVAERAEIGIAYD